ncbi:MAG: hypothetical protein DWQ30_08925 [Acidobacteria bacterium]|nr:MAG: hypothetical protein DWQ30_08925 [Acidobacteriota bacterium]
MLAFSGTPPLLPQGVHWSFELEVGAGGSFVERRSLVVDAADPSTLERWRTDFVLLDTNRSLTTYATWFERDGERFDVHGSEDRANLVLPGESAASREVVARSFRGARVGDTLHAISVVREEPYFPGTVVAIPRLDPGNRIDVRVAVDSDLPALRWSLDQGDAAREQLRVESAAHGLRLFTDELSLPPAGESVGPLHLWLSWSHDPGWEGVAAWFRTLSASLPTLDAGPPDFPAPLGDTVPEIVHEVTARVQREVRYVAVEIGIGGFRPSPPVETWRRRWGDCKDKAQLVIERLRLAGVVAFPALVLSSWDEAIDPAFATPYAFNHMIVAVPRAGSSEPSSAARSPDDPAADWLFVDPTQPEGGAIWLHPGVQGQHALVVRPADLGGGVLVRIPRRHDAERRELAVELRLAVSGEASGRAELVLHGGPAVSIHHAEDAEEAARDLLRETFDGFRVGEVVVATRPGEVPAVVVTAALSGPSPWNGSSSLRLGAASTFGTVQPGFAARRALEGSASTVWTIRLPPGASACRLGAGAERSFANAAGETRQTASLEVDSAAGVRVLVRRDTSPVLDAISDPERSEVERLALEERRFRRSRLELTCAAGGR